MLPFYWVDVFHHFGAQNLSVFLASHLSVSVPELVYVDCGSDEFNERLMAWVLAKSLSVATGSASRMLGQSVGQASGLLGPCDIPPRGMGHWFSEFPGRVMWRSQR